MLAKTREVEQMEMYNVQFHKSLEEWQHKLMRAGARQGAEKFEVGTQTDYQLAEIQNRELWYQTKERQLHLARIEF